MTCVFQFYACMAGRTFNHRYSNCTYLTNIVLPFVSVFTYRWDISPRTLNEKANMTTSCTCRLITHGRWTLLFFLTTASLISSYIPRVIQRLLDLCYNLLKSIVRTYVVSYLCEHQYRRTETVSYPTHNNPNNATRWCVLVLSWN